MSTSIAGMRYNRRVIWFSLLYAGTLIAAVYAFKHHLLGGPLAYLAAMLPALAIIGIFGSMGRYLVEERDEYLRVLATHQMLWATGIALSGATIWGFLESFDLVGHIDAYYVAVLWFFGQGVGSCINRFQGRGRAAI